MIVSISSQSTPSVLLSILYPVSMLELSDQVIVNSVSETLDAEQPVGSAGMPKIEMLSLPVGVPFVADKLTESCSVIFVIVIFPVQVPSSVN